ncbi:MAG: hypothetical protein KAS32_16770 [Candidatus Peribacteraceae bacterium]|nr:hypothetical protein [Candidatus Peribacteraceae bacterium]
MDRIIVHCSDGGNLKKAKLVEPEDISLCPSRLDYNIAERLYLEEWLKQNDPLQMTNYGIPLLNRLLTPENKNEQTVFQEATINPTKRDKEVAAAIIQWLGTNVGQSFMLEAEGRIQEHRKKERKERKIANEERIRKIREEYVQSDSL